jgi:hypothetical protein
MNFKNLFRSSLTKRHEIFAETRVNGEGPSLAVILPLKQEIQIKSVIFYCTLTLYPNPPSRLAEAG